MIIGEVIDFDGTMDSDAVAPADREFILSSMDVSKAGVYTVTVTGGLGVDDLNSGSA